MTATTITPTAGRQVWYRQRPGVHTNLGLKDDAPCAATVVHANDDGTVNLLVLDHFGVGQPLQNVTLVQPGNEAPDGSYAEWMPYQIKVAETDKPAPAKAAPKLLVATKKAPAKKPAAKAKRR